jgi:O-antigen/teichoic acid export membrane protein
MKGLKAKFVINVTGALLGICVALATVPLYVSRIGESRYGILSLVWVMLGYLGFLDFGLSRATANALAKLGQASPKDRSSVFMTALWINILLGTLGGIIIYFAGGYLLMMTHGLAGELREETQGIMVWVAPMLPLSLVSGVGIGALEARERFLIANVLQISSNALGQIIPLLTAIFIGPSLTVIVPAILVVRVLTTAVILTVVMVSEGLHHFIMFDKKRVKGLLGYGIWVTLTNLISPFMTSIDQFVIGTIIGAPFVARYAVPMTVATRLQIFNSAMSRTVFPRFSRESHSDASALAGKAVVTLAYLSGMLFAPALVTAHPFFDLWMGKTFAAYCVPVAIVLFIGAWINGLAFIPFSLLQGQGRPDLVAKLHTAEVLPYLATLWLLVHHFGLTGAAIAWTLRVTADAFVLAWLARMPIRSLLPALPAFIGIAAGLCLSMSSVVDLPLIAVIAISGILGLAVGAAGLALDPHLRQLAEGVRNRLTRRSMV